MPPVARSAHVGGNSVMADGQARSDSFADTAKAFPHALPDRLKRLEAGAAYGCMDADTARRTMIDRDEDRHLLACAEESGCHVGAPHLVNGIRDDRSIMHMWSMRRALA